MSRLGLDLVSSKDKGPYVLSIYRAGMLIEVRAI